MNPKAKKKKILYFISAQFSLSKCLYAVHISADPLLAALGWISPLLLSGFTCSYTCMPATEKTAVAQGCNTHIISEWSKHEFTMRHTAFKLMFPVT